MPVATPRLIPHAMALFGATLGICGDVRRGTRQLAHVSSRASHYGRASQRLTMVVIGCVGLAVPTLSVVVFVLVELLNAIAMPLAETSGVQVITGRSLLITTVYFSGCVLSSRSSLRPQIRWLWQPSRISS